MAEVELVTAPTDLPVTLAAAKTHCRVDHDDDDATILGLIEAATSHVDGWTGVLGMALEPQVVRWRLGRTFSPMPQGALTLPLGPAVSITSIAYTDDAGAAQTVAPAGYELIGEKLFPADAWPSGTDFVVTYTAGRGTPQSIRQAILLLVGHWYRNREATSAGGEANLPHAVDALLTPWRRGPRI